MKKKTTLFILFFLSFCTISLGQVDYEDTEVDGIAASAIGYGTKALHDYTFAAGFQSEARKKYSVAIGYQAIADHSAFVMGIISNAGGFGSFAIGSYLHSANGYTIVIGKGWDTENRLYGYLQESLFIGFKSTAPTLFVSSSNTDPMHTYRTGRVAIGNMTEPEAKLHIYADDNEDATLYLQPSKWDEGYCSQLLMGTQDFWLKTDGSLGMQFNSPDGYLFTAGELQTVSIAEGKLEIQGKTVTKGFQMFDASNPPGDGYVMQSDENGNASWTHANIGIWEDTENDDGIAYTGGNVGIGTTETLGYQLAVAGPIISTEVTVKEVNNWPDFVFSEDYELKEIENLKKFIQKYNHLPDVPNAKEVAESGIKLGEMDKILLRKIEELTLYTIQQQELINHQMEILNQQQNEIEKLKILIE